jgi:hypothetical protein
MTEQREAEMVARIAREVLARAAHAGERRAELGDPGAFELHHIEMRGEWRAFDAREIERAERRLVKLAPDMVPAPIVEVDRQLVSGEDELSHYSRLALSAAERQCARANAQRDHIGDSSRRIALA